MIGNEIKRMREKENLTQRELSEKVHLAQNTISQYEKNNRAVNSDTLKDIAETLGYDIRFIKKSNGTIQKCIIKCFNHYDLTKEMKEAILKETNIDINFEFELASDGNLDLFINHTFNKKEVEKLIKLDWFNESILEDYIDGESPFDIDDELYLSNNLFSFILQKTFGEGSSVVGVIDLDEYIELNISIPIE